MHLKIGWLKRDCYLNILHRANEQKWLMAEPARQIAERKKPLSVFCKAKNIL